MVFPLRFHVLLLPKVDWRELRSRVIWLESLGFEVVSLPDHFVDWTNPASPWFESWTSLAAIAEATQSIRLSTLVSQIPLRNPAMLARQALTLDHISDGRVEVGLGTGLAIDPGHAMTGLPNWEAGGRTERFGEYVALVDQLLSQETTTYKGRFYQADGAVMNPRPVQQPRPPILVAALGPRMMRHAVEHADIWNSLSFLPTFDEQMAETRERCLRIDAICEELGRDPATLRRSYLMFDAEARPRGGMIGYYESRERFTEQAGRIIEAGVSDVGIYFPLASDQLAMFERIATETIPELRAQHRDISSGQ